MPGQPSNCHAQVHNHCVRSSRSRRARTYLDNSQSDRAKAENCDRRAGLDLACVVYGAKACSDPASQKANLAVRIGGFGMYR